MNFVDRPSTSAAASSDAGDPWHELSIDDDDLQKLLDQPLPSQDPSKLRTGEQHAGFDNNTGESWLYPSNLPQRSYQLSIVQAALYHNTLVVLPTGLGKTFIAAVVMYNIYRWYPTGKIIFMAPTRPLVAQQIEACQRVMPFPTEDTVELTGKLPRARRTELWQSKRVFFATPQVVQSDIGCGPEASAQTAFPFGQVKLVVVDEAHRAKGRYAYTEVVQTIGRRNRYFRVLALSATPGRTMEDVADVVRNLCISHVEVRWDTSIDVLPYVHKRSMRTVVVPLGEDIKRVREEMLEIIDPYLRQLIDAQVLSGSLSNINRNFLLFEQKRFRDRSQHQRHPQQSAVSSNFSLCISLFHALELLERHGLRVFVHNFDEDEEGRAKFVVNLDRRLRDLLERLREQLGPNPFEVSAHVMTNGKMPEVPPDLDFGHPKFEQARSCLLDHFQAHPESRAIVFCEYRESVMLIYRLLLQHTPLLRPRCFVGQGGSTGSLRALTQKQQIQIMQDFRSGKSNILVATSIGEEGIDVGEVELIVCFDISTSNPQRFVQRIGRTGRQKRGNVVMLVTEGREQQLLKDVLAQKDVTNKKLVRSPVVKGALYKYAPRLVPTEYNPKCVYTYVQPPAPTKVAKPVELKKTKSKTNIKGKTKAAELSSSQDLRKFFKMPTANLLHTQVTQSTPEPAKPSASSTQTQTMEDRSLSRVKDFFKDLKEPLQTDTQLLAPTQLDLKRLRRLSKIFKSNGSMLTPAERIETPLEQLKSPKLSAEGKLFLLQHQPALVREALENMRVVEALSVEPDHDVVEEHDVRATYALVEQVLGGTRAAVEKFVCDDELEELQQQYGSSHDDLFDVGDGEFETCMTQIFDGLHDRGCFCDNFDYIATELEQTQTYKRHLAMQPRTPCKQDPSAPSKGGESMVYETIVLDDDDAFESYENNSGVVESKYQSQCQWDDFAKHAVPLNKSTPLHGPLVKAFQRQQQQEQRGGQREKFKQRLVEMAVPQTDAVPPDKIKTKVSEMASRANCAKSRNFLQRLAESDEDDEVSFDKDEVIYVPQSEANQQSSIDTTMSSTEVKETDALMSSENKDRSQNCTKEAIEHEVRFSTAAELLRSSTPSTTTANNDSANSVEMLLSELDLDAFMEPFSEEETEKQQQIDEEKAVPKYVSGGTPLKTAFSLKESKSKVDTPKSTCSERNVPTVQCTVENIKDCANFAGNVQASTSKLTVNSSQKENSNVANMLQHLAVEIARQSPDLFETSTKTPVKVPLNLLEVPQGCVIAERNSKTDMKTPPKQPPSKKKLINSPTIFDLHYKNALRRRKLPSLASTLAMQEDRTATADESVINPYRSTAKRKFRLSSGSSDEEVLKAAVAADGTQRNTTLKAQHCNEVDTECEEIAETQMPRRRSFKQQRIKRRRLNAFIDAEAAVSGGDSSDDETESFNQYVIDSMTASSDEETTQNASQMKAHYLQSLNKARLSCRGAFKIPAVRVFNDHAQIYSQPPPIEPSQYISDSFVVDEEDVKSYSEEVSLCPLERAERILKARRRAKRNRRRICKLTDSSEEERN